MEVVERGIQCRRSVDRLHLVRTSRHLSLPSLHIAQNIHSLLEGARRRQLLVAGLAVDRARRGRVVHDDQTVHVGVEVRVLRKGGEATDLIGMGNAH